MTREQNRAQFPAGPAVLTLANKGLPCRPGTRGHSVPYADNTKGESIGKREFDPDAPCSLVDAARGGRPEWRRWV